MEVKLQYPIRTFNNWQLFTNNYLTFKLNIYLGKSQYLIHKIISNIIRQEIKQETSIKKAYTKTRSCVVKSNKKPWKQKGTGKARAGSISSPIWRGGGITFGPKPGISNIKINRKLWLLAFQYLLFNKRSNIIVLDYNDKTTFYNYNNFIKFFTQQLSLCGISLNTNILCITPNEYKLNNLKLNKILFKSINTLTCKHLLFNQYIILFL
nr:ribosomal protein L4 [Coccidia sp. AB-2023a]